MAHGGLSDRTGECAALLAALGNPNRLAIMCLLIERELSVGAIAEHVGLTQSALSQHLAKLRAMRLVATRRERQLIYYSCCSPEVRTLIATLECVFASRADIRLP